MKVKVLKSNYKFINKQTKFLSKFFKSLALTKTRKLNHNIKLCYFEIKYLN